jgi:hypothetical protein
VLAVSPDHSPLFIYAKLRSIPMNTLNAPVPNDADEEAARALQTALDRRDNGGSPSAR